MSENRTKRTIAPAMVLALLITLLWAPAANAGSTYRAKGAGSQFWISWTEYDPDDLLGLPGNVHVGYLSGYDEQYGVFFFGYVSDYECEPGEVPGGGGGHAEAILFEAKQSADNGEQKALEATIASGAKSIDAKTVVDGILTELEEEVPDVIDEEFPPKCDQLPDRFLSGNDASGKPTVTFTVDSKRETLTVKGNLIVSSGGHGGGDVLGRPPINMTITGGDWQKYESSYKGSGKDYSYSYWQKGTDFYGGTVTGAIGAMGFADDADDESYGGFGSFSYRTVERIRF